MSSGYTGYLGQVFDHQLIALKGWPFESAVDIVGLLSSNVNINSTGQPAQAGQCVHATTAVATTASFSVATGPPPVNLEMGANSGNSNNVYNVPLFLTTGSADFTVSNPGVAAGIALGGDSTHTPAWVPAIPAGYLHALVSLGAYELETTEFDTSLTYRLGQPLRAVTSNTDANAGKLTNVNAVTNQSFTGNSAGTNGGLLVVYTDTVVGWVSRGTYTNGYGKTVLSFWPDFLPGTR
jgi:hypothetical protein